MVVLRTLTIDKTATQNSARMIETANILHHATARSLLRKIIPIGADRSYGIHVAKLAGIPRPVIQRVNEILMQLAASSREIKIERDERYCSLRFYFV